MEDIKMKYQILKVSFIKKRRVLLMKKIQNKINISFLLTLKKKYMKIKQILISKKAIKYLWKATIIKVKKKK